MPLKYSRETAEALSDIPPDKHYAQADLSDLPPDVAGKLWSYQDLYQRDEFSTVGKKWLWWQLYYEMWNNRYKNQLGPISSP